MNPRIIFVIGEDDKKLIEEEAYQSRMSVSSWVRSVVCKAAEKQKEARDAKSK